MKFYLKITAITILLSSCLKQSIPDAMLGNSGKKNKITATLSYEINGNPVSIIVDDADNQLPGFRKLECVKSNGYVLAALGNSGDFVFTFFTDSLKVASYNFPGTWGPMYITTFQGVPHDVYYPTDNMNFNVTTHQDGHISGNFFGKLTPVIGNIPGAPGSVSIEKGIFKNVPVFY
jgi:hypothetical protein